MKRSLIPSGLLLSIIVLLVVMAGCATKDNKITDVIVPPPLFEGLSYGEPETFEILTWNLENFPEPNTGDRIEYAIAALRKLSVDIVGFQEIKGSRSFAQVVDSLPGYAGYLVDDYQALAFIWNTETVTVNSIYEIYTSDRYAFPRSPLVMDCSWMGVPLIVIDNHLKAMSGEENEARRESACIKLDAYIKSYHPDDQVIVLGDMNDELVDSGNNVFQTFLDAPDDYLFTDIEIAADPALHWSYPSWPSHLDHILISNELFPEFETPGSEIQTLRVEQYLQGQFNEYNLNLSDHRPVGLRLALTPVIAEPTPRFEDLSFGSDNALDVMTWNLEFFPGYNPATRVSYTVDALSRLQMDIIALQEITSASRFTEVVDSLPGYEGFRADSAYEDLDLAFIWNAATVDVDTIYEIYTYDDYAFPRSPLVMESDWRGETLIVVNNHLKASGEEDDVARRQAACNLLDTWISTYHPDDRVIVLGDMNDLLDDSQTNVFQVFLDAPARYSFADMDIATGPASGWSYPGWPSHLDHILVSNELFDDLDADGSLVTTLRLDQYLNGGFDEYETNLSDHLPVVMSLSPDPLLR